MPGDGSLLSSAPGITAGVVTSAVFGGMVLFAFIYAPLVFIKLPAETAGGFIRSVFPVYYAAMAASSAVAGLLLLPQWTAAVMLAVSATFLAARFALMPRINAARDASLAAAGDAGAKRRFARLHRLSVIVNFVQMLAVLAVLIHLFAATAGRL